MEFFFFSRWHNKYGGSNVYSPIGDLLELRLDQYGEAIQTFDFEAYLRNATYKCFHMMLDLYEQHHEYLTKLPKVAFHRKRKKLTIEFESKVMTAEEEESRSWTVETINSAAREFAAILPLIEKRLKKSDDFDYARFTADATRLLAQGFASQEDVEAVCAEAKAKRQAEQAKKSWWEREDMDWDKFDPTARTILDEPFYWDCGDDFAPHGNDTGADLLTDYRKWARRHLGEPPMTFLNRLFAEWGITPIDWNVTAENEVRKLAETKDMELSVSNEAIIALAFAVLKVKGECPGDISDLALKALQRDSYNFIEDGMTDKNKELHRAAIAKMRAKLEQLATTT